MRERRRMSYLVGILSLCLAVTGLYGGTALCGDDEEKGGWIQEHIMAVPDMEMYEPYFVLFGQREADRIVDYTYEEVVKLAGHSCGATSSAWEMTRKALEILYPDETPVRGNINVYAPGAEDEWNIGVIGEVITYITGAAPHTGFSGAEFANGWPPPPNTVITGDPVYKRRNKMVYTTEPNDPPVPNAPNSPNAMIWRFERLDTGAEVCLSFNYGGPMGIQPQAVPMGYWQTLGARIAGGHPVSAEEIESYITWWNDRTEYVFENADSLVVLRECPGDAE